MFSDSARIDIGDKIIMGDRGRLNLRAVYYFTFRSQRSHVLLPTSGLNVLPRVEGLLLEPRLAAFPLWRQQQHEIRTFKAGRLTLGHSATGVSA